MKFESSPRPICGSTLPTCASTPVCTGGIRNWEFRRRKNMVEKTKFFALEWILFYFFFFIWLHAGNKNKPAPPPAPRTRCSRLNFLDAFMKIEWRYKHLAEASTYNILAFRWSVVGLDTVRMSRKVETSCIRGERINSKMEKGLLINYAYRAWRSRCFRLIEFFTATRRDTIT